MLELRLELGLELGLALALAERDAAMPAAAMTVAWLPDEDVCELSLPLDEPVLPDALARAQTSSAFARAAARACSHS